MTKVQRYKVGYYTDGRGMLIVPPRLIPDDSGFAIKFEDYCKLETELAALKAENEWRDIETAPKDCTEILAVTDVGQMVVFFEGGYWREKANFMGLKREPTHWMPLPKPPVMAQGEKG